MSEAEIHEGFMREALVEARRAEAAGDVPIGAVIVRERRIIARAGNRRAADNDPVAHAELVAIRAAAATLADWRLTGCTLYVTLEPCVMCAGAIVLARVDTVVYGAADPKAGAVETLYHLLDDPRLNHRPTVIAGVLADECGQMLTDFFRRQRAMGKK